MEEHSRRSGWADSCRGTCRGRTIIAAWCFDSTLADKELYLADILSCDHSVQLCFFHLIPIFIVQSSQRWRRIYWSIPCSLKFIQQRVQWFQDMKTPRQLWMWPCKRFQQPPSRCAKPSANQERALTVSWKTVARSSRNLGRNLKQKLRLRNVNAADGLLGLCE